MAQPTPPGPLQVIADGLRTSGLLSADDDTDGCYRRDLAEAVLLALEEAGYSITKPHQRTQRL